MIARQCATNRARSHYIAKAAEREARMVYDGQIYPLSSAERDMMGNRVAAEQARQHLASLSPERRRQLDAEWVS